MLYSIGAVLLKVRRNRDFRLRGKLPRSVTRELGSRTENLIQQQESQKTHKKRQDNITKYEELCMFHIRPLRNIYTCAVNQEIIIIIFINCNWVVTRWQWLFYVYTKHEIGYY